MQPNSLPLTGVTILNAMTKASKSYKHFQLTQNHCSNMNEWMLSHEIPPLAIGTYTFKMVIRDYHPYFTATIQNIRYG